MTRRLCDWLMGWGALIAGTALLILFGWTTLAWADQSHAWGSGDDGPCVVVIEPCGDLPDCAAVVRMVNRLVWGATDLPGETLTLDGLSVVVSVDQRDYRTPDVLTVLAPPGYRADPPALDVADDGEGVVVIRPVPMS